MSFKDFLGMNFQLDDLGDIAKKANEEVAEISLEDKAFSNAIYNLRANAMALVLTIAENVIDGDLEDEESFSERLDVLANEVAGDDDNIVLSALYANMQDAMVSLGVPESIAEDALFSDDELQRDEAIESMADYVNSNVPEEEDYQDWWNEFVFGEDDDEGEFDDEPEQLDDINRRGVIYHKNWDKVKHKEGNLTTKNGLKGRGFKKKRFNVVYKAVKAIRDGKVTMVNKRVGGTYKVSSKQRQALKKLSRKSKKPDAILKWKKSMNARKKAGLKNFKHEK